MLKSIEFLREKSRGRVGGGGGLSPLAPVILCPVHRILLQQGTNLVNKLVLLLHKCQLREDSRNKSENDGCWGRGVSAFSQYGRSMIEMLGVLAIIGVLSVGGIAGYSKAMEKWKINRTINEYSMLMAGLLEYKDNFIKNTPAQSEPGIVDFVQAAHLVPETWIKKSNINMNDSLGNHVGIYFSNKRNANGYDVGDRFVFNLYFGSSKTSDNSFQYNLCRTFFKDLGVAMSYNMLAMGMIPVAQNTNYAGDSRCHGGLGYNGETRKCLRDMTLTEISDICKTCQTTNCGVVFVF